MKNEAKEIHIIDWQGRSIEVRYCRSWSDAYEEVYGYPISHLEVEAIRPCKSALPFTETGYRSLFTTADDIESAGGAVAYVRAWLDWSSKTPEWKESEAATQQYSLF
jgi:hypothetical protein